MNIIFYNYLYYYKMDKYHNKIITYNNINKILKSREQIISLDKYKSKFSQIINKKIISNKPILFYPNDILEISMPEEEYKPWVYKLIIYGNLIDSRKCAVIIEGIYPYFYVKIPNNNIEDINSYNDEFKENIINIINKQLDSYENNNKTAISKNLIENKTEIVQLNKFKGYYNNEDRKDYYIKLYFKKLKWRKKIINFLRSEFNYETYSDDLNNYYRVILRNNNIKISSWIILNNYTFYAKDDTNFKVSKLNVDTFIINYDRLVNNFCNYDNKIHRKILKPYINLEINNNLDYYNNINEIDKINFAENAILLNDPTISITWDIETYAPNYELPKPENKNHNIFMIGLTIQYNNDDNSLIKIIIIDKPCTKNSDFLTIACKTEYNIIKCFSDIINIFKPEFILGFNDSIYDWDWLIKRAKQYKLLRYLLNNMSCYNYNNDFDDELDIDEEEDNIYKWNYKKESIKLEANTTINTYSFKLPGYINIDIRTEFRKIFPTAEKSSLNYFLKINNIELKEDMPYKKIFDTYEEYMLIYNERYNKKNNNEIISDDLENKYKKYKNIMSDISKYCVVDAKRCHQLLLKRSVLVDNRETSNLTYCSLYDALFRGNGLKVRQIIYNKGYNNFMDINKKYIFSSIPILENINKYNGKYPGARVLDPIKGLVKSKLTIREKIQKAKYLKSKKSKE